MHIPRLPVVCIVSLENIEFLFTHLVHHPVSRNSAGRGQVSTRRLILSNTYPTATLNKALAGRGRRKTHFAVRSRLCFPLPYTSTSEQKFATPPLRPNTSSTKTVRVPSPTDLQRCRTFKRGTQSDRNTASPTQDLLEEMLE